MYAEMKKKKVEAETGIPFESIHYDNIELELPTISVTSRGNFVPNAVWCSSNNYTINVYDILNHSKFIVTKDALSKISEVYA